MLLKTLAPPASVHPGRPRDDECGKGARRSQGRAFQQRQATCQEKICVITEGIGRQANHAFYPVQEAGKFMCHPNVSLPNVNPAQEADYRQTSENY
jgi:hypothetical protein